MALSLVTLRPCDLVFAFCTNTIEKKRRVRWVEIEKYFVLLYFDLKTA